MAHEINDANFKAEVLDHKGLVLVDFWAPWCGPCRMQAPELDKLAALNKDIKICKINVDDHVVTAQQFGVQSIPTLIIFKDGKAVDKAVGVTPAATLDAKAKALLK
ncbi:MAG: thioredoxin [Firmicutes bacterium]|nr:thioredoxin [Bacillota bacterium]